MKPLLTAITLFAIASAATAQEITIARAGSHSPQPGPAEFFTGAVRVERLFAAIEPARASGGLVTFEA
ncbi:MAG: carboxymuconolactone decarboxylase, partial [Verrucomicrobiota bacterium]